MEKAPNSSQEPETRMPCGTGRLSDIIGAKEAVAYFDSVDRGIRGNIESILAMDREDDLDMMRAAEAATYFRNIDNSQDQQS